MTPAALIGAGWASFLFLTFVLFGAAGALTGHSLARNWRPARQLLGYALLLAAGDRFLLYALFGGALLSAGGFALAFAAILAGASLAYRLTLVRRMVAQYPWLYRRAGPFGWRERSRTDGA